ncbi:Cobalt transport protein CbiM [bioreactor metagenome]|uniref:Cobalt transport protein CbiM n=2 Tax=root TaxID=1 RepID=A0A562J6S5_9FIRM|nr:energy-coupling factor ABC transporter permease [Sedimentibacter saalensis]MEA5096377.1 energy-coupling factor ABC transporter permease [Sedimentibacter saalensis]TWH78644.1 cobalt/nickel transport system permease protein [Sedimentibacter saalensis]
MKGKYNFILLFVSVLILTPNYALGMHIMEGFLPLEWGIFWFVVCLPFLILSMRKISKMFKVNANQKLLFALVTAFVFILSALKMPSITGSTSHPTGMGLGAILLGPLPMSVSGLIVLLFQALLLAHGGITTLGANLFSMGIAGPFVSFFIYKIFKSKNKKAAVFLAAACGDLFTYVVTSVQLAFAHPDMVGGVMASMVKFLGVFAITQIPLAIAEGILTAIIYDLVVNYQNEGGYEIEKYN